MSFPDAAELATHPDTRGQLVLAGEAGAGWALAVEPYGYQGSRQEALRAVSAGGRAVSAYWDINARTQLGHAVDGQVLARLDPQQQWGADPASLDPYLADVDLAADEQVAVLTVAGRISGFRLDAQWLAASRACFWVTPLPGCGPVLRRSGRG